MPFLHRTNPSLFAALTVFILSAAVVSHADSPKAWVIDEDADWKAQIESSEGMQFAEGMASPEAKKGSLKTKFHSFEKKTSLKTLTIDQSPIWQNWEPIANIGPSNLADAPVMLTMGPDDYWMFGRYSGKKPNATKGKQQAAFTAEDATLEGFDIPLKTTPFPNQYDAPGGLLGGKGGYHAWQSRDMVNWVHHGAVTENRSRWVTTAEQKDGKVYIYYDYPNDQDPHLYIDSDLTDGIPGEDKGMAFKDPSHGSDCAFIRDLDGKFHVIYEDWSPINASKRSWDSPLAGHAVSETGEGDFTILDPPVDNRTTPTGKIGTYKHPHWMQHPDYDTNVAEFEIHEPEQEAYGDWAAISISGQYYLFGDFDPVGGHQMSVGWFTSSSIDEEFTWCDNIGKGHPDPDVCFAEGKFYLATQQKTDFTSTGPWVETVEARVGVDTNNDGKSDSWTEWAELKETYDYVPGRSKQIAKTPAQIDLSKAPDGFGFQVELRVTDSTENKSKPIIDRVAVSFE